MPTKRREPAVVEKLFYRRKDAAYALSLSLRSIDRMIGDRVFVTRRIGSSVVIPATDIKRFAAQVLRSDMLVDSAQKRA